MVYLVLFVLPACLQFLTFSAVVLHFANVSSHQDAAFPATMLSFIMVLGQASLKDMTSKEQGFRTRIHRAVL